MPKKLMEDMKSGGGVRITKILKDEVKGVATEPSLGKRARIADISKEEVEPEELRKRMIKVVENESLKREAPRKIYSSTPQIKKEKKKLRRPLVVLFFLAILFTGVYFIGGKFERANIYVIAKHGTYNLDKVQLESSNDKSAPIAFELMIVSNEEYKDLTLSQSENASTKAKGEITFYNEYSTKAQGLAIHTFVSDPSGKTYQTDKAVSIPGYKTVAGKVVPGQVSVGITAFLAGSSYNGEPSDFSINGFKGTAKAKKIYGKLKTPLKGGAQGLVYSLSPSDKGAITAFAQSTFKNNLLKKASAQVPAGYILYPNAMTFSYTSDVDVLFPSPDVKVKTSGSVASFIIDEKNLSDALVKKLLPDVSDREFKEIKIADMQSLKFNFKSDNQIINKEVKNISFNLSGTVNALWNPDVNLLLASVTGIAKKNLIPVFEFDPAIESATARVFPPWQSYLPLDSKKIHIHLN